MKKRIIGLFTLGIISLIFLFGVVNAQQFTDFSSCPNPNGNLIINTPTTWTQSYTCNSVTIKDNSILIFDSSVHKVPITLKANNLTIEQGSSISADGKGYKGGYVNQNGFGPGKGLTYYGKGSGGGYGGKGTNLAYGRVGSLSYGNKLKPTDLGSGGSGDSYGKGGNGGGAIKLIIFYTLTNNGLISSNSLGTIGGGGGSGGSIYVITNKLMGNGVFSTNGGKGGYHNGGGGGGRIAIYYGFNNFLGRIDSQGAKKGTIELIQQKQKKDYYEYENNNCTQVSLTSSQVTSNDYNTLEKCQNNITTIQPIKSIWQTIQSNIRDSILAIWNWITNLFS